ncbi:quinon protein alcohol dehydrogenase-like superfamily [Annulohypoxylon bovei var. microspora]|nr:quinon protein alcohol dehydrogenase-like superfamily [Annulohypoxylon bovei var. microspora]
MMESAARSSFRGEGIQHSGSGNLHIGGDVVISPSNNQCLADLRLTDPGDDKARIEQIKGGLLRESYHWILEHDEFLRWRNNPDSGLLWIKGDPGKGKTMLLCGIIDEMKKQPADTTQLLSFFFCQATDDRLNNAIGVLRGLIYLIVKHQPSLMSYIKNKYEHAGKALFEDVNAWVALSGIFTNILQDPELPSTILVIDALDECETHLRQLLDLIVKIPHRSNIKWLLSSRNRVDIERKLGPDQSRTRLSLELKSNADHVSDAVDAYIDHCISNIPGLQNNADLQTQTRNQMREKACGTFLWVGLVAQELKEAHHWELEDIINELPVGLEELYGRMMQQILGLKRQTPKYCLEVLSTVATTYRPLCLKELAALSGLSNGPFGSQDTINVVKLCGSFLTIQEDYIFIIHQSAQDFLYEKESTTIFPRGVKATHYNIFSRSIQTMSQTLRPDVYDLEDWGISPNEIVPPSPDPLADLGYSCIYWVDHLAEYLPGRQSQCKDLRDDGIVNEFIQQHYLHWLEALSILESVPNGISAITKLNRITQNTGEQLSRFVQDATRFIRYSKQAIESSPLQVYGSALIFSPSQSIIRSRFQSEVPPWLLLKPAVDDQWGACLATCEGHNSSVRSVAFSPDGSRVASCTTFFDREIKIWDVTTGECTITLKCPPVEEPDKDTDEDLSVAFSPDGSQLIASWGLSLSNRKITKVWDVTTGECTATLNNLPVECSTHEVPGIAISPNGNLRAFFSIREESIEIRNIETDSYVATFEGHNGGILAAAFSPDGSRLASGSEDKTVRIWDMATTAYLATPKGHEYAVSSVTFSPDGSRLASYSDNKTIKIWDTTTGECIATYEGYDSWIWSITFLPDESRLASFLENQTIKIWDITTGECTATHCNLDSSKVFSHDGRCLLLDPHTILPPSVNTVQHSTAHQQFHNRLEVEREWITCNGQKLLWLPVEYRPYTKAVAAQTVAAGCANCRVWMSRFQFNGPMANYGSEEWLERNNRRRRNISDVDIKEVKGKVRNIYFHNDFS